MLLLIALNIIIIIIFITILQSNSTVKIFCEKWKLAPNDDRVSAVIA